MQEKQYPGVIDLKTLGRIIRDNRLKFFIILPIVFVVCLFVFNSIPKYYNCRVELAPEINRSSSETNVSALLYQISGSELTASNIDAIYPLLYPNLMSSDNFCIKLFDIPVKTYDGKIKTSYYQYLKKHTKHSWWSDAFNSMLKWFKKKPKEARVKNVDTNGNIIMLTEEEEKIVEAIQSNTKCIVDRKLGKVIILITDQDPLVCATIADKITYLLENSIKDYRTKKATIDYNYFQGVYEDAVQEYDKINKEYINFSTVHHELSQDKLRIYKQELESMRSLKLQNMAIAEKRMQVARAAIQERTPVFTMMQNPVVPSEVAGPDVLFYTFAMTLLAALCIIGYAIRHRLIELID